MSIVNLDGSPINEEGKKPTSKGVKESDFKVRADAIELELAVLCKAMTQYAAQMKQDVTVAYKRYNNGATNTIRGIVTIKDETGETVLVERNVEEKDKKKSLNGYYRHMMVSGMFYDLFTAGVVYIKAEKDQREATTQAFNINIDVMDVDACIKYITMVHPSNAKIMDLTLYIKGENWDTEKLKALPISDIRGVCKVIKGIVINGTPQRPSK